MFDSEVGRHSVKKTNKIIDLIWTFNNIFNINTHYAKKILRESGTTVFFWLY